MPIFNVLLVVNTLAAFIALARLRPCAFIFAGNQMIVLRALSNISYYGRPVSQQFVPDSVFGDDNLRVAATIFGIATALFVASLALPGPRRRQERLSLPKPPRWLLALIAMYFVVVFFSEKTIFESSYHAPDQFNYVFNLGGAHALIYSVFLYEMYRRLARGEWPAWKAFAATALLLFATDYIKGSTGLATGLFATAVILLLGSQRRFGLRWISFGAALGGIVVIAVAVRGIRNNYAIFGGRAVTDLEERLVHSEADTAETGQGLESSGNGEQYAAHVLECVSLYDAGIGREWRSVYDPLIYTFEPAFLLPALGLTRPIEAAWELAAYFIHGGGIYFLGELYWNGGLACVALITAIIVLFMFFCDSRYRTSFTWLTFTCQFAPSLFMGLGYGFAQISRGAINGLWVLASVAAYRWLYRNRSAGARSRTFGASVNSGAATE